MKLPFKTTQNTEFQASSQIMWDHVESLESWNWTRKEHRTAGTSLRLGVAPPEERTALHLLVLGEAPSSRLGGA